MATAYNRSKQINMKGNALKIDQIIDTAGAAVDATELTALTGTTATAAEINMAADNSANTEVVTTTNVITAAESGKTFILNSATGFVSTLPAVAAGLRFKFIVGNTPPTSGNHTVITPSTPNLIDGVVAFDTVVPFANEDTISFVASTAIAGDWVEVFCDGTNWYVTGAMATTGAITGTQAD